MAGSVNKVILVGNLGKDPEIRRTQDGRPIANLSVATSETWRDKATGERKDKTQWHRVVIFNDRLADVAQQYVKKGMKVFVEGQLQSRKYPDKETGQEREIYEVVISRFKGDFQMLDSRGSSAGAETGNGGMSDSARPSGRTAPKQSAGGKDFDDDIPF
jgi:single-strand DNA-binding protein